MSEDIKHECGVALLRPLKSHPGDWGGAKLSLLLEKQHNRGQDGVGAATELCGEFTVLKDTELQGLLSQIAKRDTRGEDIFLGHLRYATFGRKNLDYCHPFLSGDLALAGNFNLTENPDQSRPDCAVVCERIASKLDKGIVTALKGTLSGLDGAYVFVGMTKGGEAFAIRDPHAIRPGYYYISGEFVAVASERPAIQAAFDCSVDDVKPLPPGKALVIDKEGRAVFHECLEPLEKRSCVFERIYFSRANDHLIHHERKMLGAALANRIIEAADGDIENTFFSYIPNSAQVSFHGLLEKLFKVGMREGKNVRFGQICVKDAKFRTFIADAASRKEFYKHVYDVTYGLVREGKDDLVVIDDSIVRGNTMRNAILPMLDRLGPKKIVIASSAPPIKYPDCYGIDMSTLGELVAFRALVNLLGEKADEELKAAYESADLNPLEKLYARFSDAELSKEVARLLTPPELKAEVEVVYQRVKDLHQCCPLNKGDWYFTGDYPTPGGYKVLRKALKNYLEKSNDRSY